MIRTDERRCRYSYGAMELGGITEYALRKRLTRANSTGAICEAYAVMIFDELGCTPASVAQALYIRAAGRLYVFWRGVESEIQTDDVGAGIAAWIATQA